MVRLVKLRFHASYADDFVRIFKEHRPKLLKQPGCQGVTLFRDQEDPSTFITLSNWRSKEDLEKYKLSSVFASIWKQVKPTFSRHAEVQNLKVIDHP